jgi:hypothetical protein
MPVHRPSIPSLLGLALTESKPWGLGHRLVGRNSIWGKGAHFIAFIFFQFELVAVILLMAALLLSLTLLI